MGKKPTYQALEKLVAELRGELKACQSKSAIGPARTMFSSPDFTSLLHAVVNNTQSVIYVKDVGGRYILVNENFCDIIQRPEKEVLGKTPFDLFPADVARQHIENDRRVIQTRKPATFNEQSALPDGRHHFISVKFPIIDDAGAVSAVGGISTDITERVRAEENLRQSEEKFRLAFHTSPDAINLNRLEDGLYIDINEGFTHLMGYTREDVIGKTSLALNIWKNPQDRQRLVEGLRKQGHIRNLEAGFVRKNGEAGVGLMCAHVLQLNHEKVILSITRDITESKRAETALRESESRYRTFFAEGPDGIVILDPQTHRPIEFNDQVCQMLGYSREAFAQVHLPAIEAPDASGGHPSLIANLAAEGHRNFDTRLQTPAGEIRNVNMTAQMITLAGHPVCHCMLRDITEKTKLQQQLQQSQKFEAIGTLAGGIAHDFNNLLMGIQGRSSLLAVDLDPGANLREHVDAIENYVRSATNLTKQLLGFARGGKYEVKPVDLNELLRASAAMFGRTRKEIRIHTKTHAAPLVVEADRPQIEQVLLNLFVNAWQAMPDGGELFLATSVAELDEATCTPHQVPPGRYAKLSVTDTGIGIDAASQQRIFDPFFTTKEKDRGTGLGLASAFGIINNHAGFISVYSEVGQGATFNIYLPLSGRELQPDLSGKERLIKGSETILLVDDEKMILEVGAAMLAKLGYRVVTAQGGQKAVDVIRRQGRTIDLVILDLIMPGMDGGKTYDRIREIQPVIPVVLSSGYSINGQAAEIMQRGCNGFIQKPFNIAELSQKIREVLDAARRMNVP